MQYLVKKAMLLKKKLPILNFKHLHRKIGMFCSALPFILSHSVCVAQSSNIDPIVKSLHTNLKIAGNTSALQHSALIAISDIFIINNPIIRNYILLIILSIVIYVVQRHRERKTRQILTFEIDCLTAKHKDLLEKYKHVLVTENEPIESQDQRLLRKALDVVDRNIGNPLFGVEKMALEMGMSRTNMHRKIKAITGFSASELIRNVRMKKAAQLLLNHTDSISQISFAVGFEDHSYFSKSFKKQFGVPPSDYIQTKV